MEYLQYGLLDGTLIHISQVESGLKCNCLCPSCASRLIAKKGSTYKYHFAHYRTADCNHGTESALHIMTKECVAEQKKLWVPFFPEGVYDSETGKIITFDSSELENQVSATIRSDVMLSIGGKALNVEIKVTHKVDVHKQIEIFNLGLPTIEIDFSDVLLSFTPEIISQRLLAGTHTKLIFSPKAKEIFAKRLLGEWKKIFFDSYVEDCPLTRKRAYFVDYLGKGGPTECHECYGWEECDRKKGKYLCRGFLGNLNYDEIDKILIMEREEKYLRHVKLLLKDGSIYERSW